MSRYRYSEHSLNKGRKLSLLADILFWKGSNLLQIREGFGVDFKTFMLLF